MAVILLDFTGETIASSADVGADNKIYVPNSNLVCDEFHFKCRKRNNTFECTGMKFFSPQCPNPLLGCSSASGALVPAITVCAQEL